MEAGERQRAHYDTIHDEYEQHYYDLWYTAYRRGFIYDPMLSGIDLTEKLVVDLACGSGHNSVAVLEKFPGARTIGLDVSVKARRDYRSRTGGKAFDADLTQPLNLSISADGAIIVAGLHHCVSNLPQALANVSALLKPSGAFLMFKPSNRFFLEFAERNWYRRDRYFDHQTERALDHDALYAMARDSFTIDFVKHIGGPPYFLVLSSLTTGVPVSVKPKISKPLIAGERLYNRMPIRFLHSAFVARWWRTPVNAVQRQEPEADNG